MFVYCWTRFGSSGFAYIYRETFSNMKREKIWRRMHAKFGVSDVGIFKGESIGYHDYSISDKVPIFHSMLFLKKKYLFLFYLEASKSSI